MPRCTEPGPGDRVLAVVAHPDDEAWAFGASLARWARAGVEVHVVCATRGEAGADALGRAVAGADLGAIREDELRRSCAALGLGDPIVLDLPDGALASVPLPDAVRALEPAWAARDPTVVVTLGMDGGYGHRDHLAVTAWVAAMRADRILHAALPVGLLHPVWRGLRRAGFAGVVPGIRPEQFGIAAPDLTIDVTDTLAARRAALACHASQLRGGDVDAFLRPGLMAARGPFEAFVCAR